MTSTAVYVSPEADRIAEQSLRNVARLSDYRHRSARLAQLGVDANQLDKIIEEERHHDTALLAQYVMDNYSHCAYGCVGLVTGEAIFAILSDRMTLAQAEAFVDRRLGGPHPVV